MRFASENDVRSAIRLKRISNGAFDEIGICSVCVEFGPVGRYTANATQYSSARRSDLSALYRLYLSLCTRRFLAPVGVLGS